MEKQLLQSWGIDVKDRDGWQCVICKEYGRNKVRAHHIFNKQFYPKLRFNVNNGITLCSKHEKECHL